MHVGDQIRQCVVHAIKLFTRKAATHRCISAHAEKYCIVFLQQLVNSDVFTDFNVKAEFDTHLFHDLATGQYHFFFEFKRRYAKR